MRVVPIAVILGISFISVLADINLHNPRGSNNRLNGRGRNVNGATRERLFDSENNDRSGYNEGTDKISEKENIDMVYCANSKLIFEWANQHEANGEKTHAKVIIQYMCAENIWNGNISKKTPDEDKNCLDDNCDTDTRFGRHESMEYYKHCSARERFAELATPYDNINANRKTARFTRQNRNGRRYGFECPEERDHYPYPGSSPWKDIAILTSNPDDCRKNIQPKSQNTEDRFQCEPTKKYMTELRGKSDEQIRREINTFIKDTKRTRQVIRGRPIIPVDEEKCKNTLDSEGNPFTWENKGNHGLNPPICGELPATRINHNGNTKEGEFGRFAVHLADVIHKDDIGKPLIFKITYVIGADDLKDGKLDTERLGFIGDEDETSEEKAEKQGYVFKDNPKVKIFEDIDAPLKIAINTNQYPRTFQDRSHPVKVITKGCEGKVHNVNVRGKRGNIVQVYPAVEYSFVPNKLEVCPGDIIHFQWTGSNFNPKNNAGAGEKGTDRSNVILMSAAHFDTLHCKKKDGSCASTNVPDKLAGEFMGASIPEKLDMAVTALKTTYFGRMVIVTKPGKYYYMCTRNNNFTNRSQKGCITVLNEDDPKCSKKRDPWRDIEKRLHDNIARFKVLARDFYN